MSFAPLLFKLREFVKAEQAAGAEKLQDTWRRPLEEKLSKGLSQRFTHLERGDNAVTLWASLDDQAPDSLGSRWREGDLLRLHGGDVFNDPLGTRLTLEAEEDGRWLLRGHDVARVWEGYAGGPCFADPDGMDLTPYFERALDEICKSHNGLQVVLPLLAGQLELSIDDPRSLQGQRVAQAEGFNSLQAEAVGLGLGAEPLACIQGPPGTGKTRVLALIARLLVESGERVLVTSHTHMAINNALNKIHALGVPAVKVGAFTQRKGLDEHMAHCTKLTDWKARPAGGGYVVGATPFATCSDALESHEFDVVIFDEASQITVPLALMAMRKGKRFIFIGDQKQLPPVVLSRSVLDKDTLSVFAALTAPNADHTTMLSDTYRMNRWLTEWPSQTHYGGQLRAVGHHREQTLALKAVPAWLAPVFDASASGVFIPTLDRSARARNLRDAKLVLQLCEAAFEGGLALNEIGIVTPYRLQGRTVRDLLARRFGRALARQVVADTVERMQGQERTLIVLSLATGDPGFLAAVAPFFFRPERMNVSVTRAVSKLIVIGPSPDPLFMVGDPTVQAWVAQYGSLIAGLKRIQLDSACPNQGGA